jgi:hypothetical protein
MRQRLNSPAIVEITNQINLASIATDSSEVVKRLAREACELKTLLEIRALRENSRDVIVNTAGLDEISFRSSDL